MPEESITTLEGFRKEFNQLKSDLQRDPYDKSKRERLNKLAYQDSAKLRRIGAGDISERKKVITEVREWRRRFNKDYPTSIRADRILDRFNAEFEKLKIRLEARPRNKTLHEKLQQLQKKAFGLIPTTSNFNRAAREKMFAEFKAFKSEFKEKYLTKAKPIPVKCDKILGRFNATFEDLTRKLEKHPYNEKLREKLKQLQSKAYSLLPKHARFNVEERAAALEKFRAWKKQFTKKYPVNVKVDAPLDRFNSQFEALKIKLESDPYNEVLRKQLRKMAVRAFNLIHGYYGTNPSKRNESVAAFREWKAQFEQKHCLAQPSPQNTPKESPNKPNDTIARPLEHTQGSDNPNIVVPPKFEFRAASPDTLMPRRCFVSPQIMQNGGGVAIAALSPNPLMDPQFWDFKTWVYEARSLGQEVRNYTTHITKGAINGIKTWVKTAPTPVEGMLFKGSNIYCTILLAGAVVDIGDKVIKQKYAAAAEETVYLGGALVFFHYLAKVAPRFAGWAAVALAAYDIGKTVVIYAPLVRDEALDVMRHGGTAVGIITNGHRDLSYIQEVILPQAQIHPILETKDRRDSVSNRIAIRTRRDVGIKHVHPLNPLYPATSILMQDTGFWQVMEVYSEVEALTTDLPSQATSRPIILTETQQRECLVPGPPMKFTVDLPELTPQTTNMKLLQQFLAKPVATLVIQR